MTITNGYDEISRADLDLQRVHYEKRLAEVDARSMTVLDALKGYEDRDIKRHGDLARQIHEVGDQVRFLGAAVSKLLSVMKPKPRKKK